MLSLAGKVAFISGAGSVGDDPDAKVWGNGKATAVLLARQGATIYGVDLRKEAADVTKAIIDTEGGTCVTRGVDMTKAKKVEAAVDDCAKRSACSAVGENMPTRSTSVPWMRSMPS